MVEDLEKKEHFVKLTLTKEGEDEPTSFEVVIPEGYVNSLYNAEIEFDIFRRVTLIEERSISDIQKKEK